MGTTTLNTIVEAMARALFVSAYADHCDEDGSDPDLPRAGPGEDWMDIAPPTPQYAVDTANRLLGRYEEANKTNIWALLFKAAVEDGEIPKDGTLMNLPLPKYASDFGHYLAMMALGHGVSWFDDHVEFDLVVPHVEFIWEEL
jgi:hypothetical protein